MLAQILTFDVRTISIFDVQAYIDMLSVTKEDVDTLKDDWLTDNVRVPDIPP